MIVNGLGECAVLVRGVRVVCVGRVRVVCG